MPLDIQDDAIAGQAEAQRDAYVADVKAHSGKDEAHPVGHLESGVRVKPETSDDDFVAPTEDDLATLRRVPEKLPWTTYAIAFCELAERFSYYGAFRSSRTSSSSRVPPAIALVPVALTISLVLSARVSRPPLV